MSVAGNFSGCFIEFFKGKTIAIPSNANTAEPNAVGNVAADAYSSKCGNGDGLTEQEWLNHLVWTGLWTNLINR